MKVLWFTNTPCAAAEKLQLKSHGGGWLKALELELGSYPDIDLHICFYSAQPYEPFKYGNTTYIPVQRKNRGSKLQRLVQRITEKNYDQQELQHLLAVTKTVQPDIIHIHGTEDNFGLLQQQIQVPAVLSIQGILNPLSEKFFAGIPASEALRKESLKAKLSFRSAGRLHKSLRKNAVRETQILKQTRNVIGRTDWDKRVSRIMAPGSQYYINNEALRPAFYEARWNKQAFNQPLKIVTISSDAIYKGFETIVKTARLLTAYPALQFEWVIAGLHMNSDIVHTTLKWLKENTGSLNIKLIGSASEKELVQLLLEADIYCQVSHIENSPNSLCEAMLIGMPVIASYAGGTASLLDNEKEGMLVQNGDAHALAGAIIQLNDHFPLAAAMGEKARARALQRHNKQAITSDLIQIYKTVINHRSLHES
jgi:glycosyltransferase involved in cell wall biosynthesis